MAQNTSTVCKHCMVLHHNESYLGLFFINIRFIFLFDKSINEYKFCPFRKDDMFTDSSV